LCHARRNIDAVLEEILGPFLFGSCGGLCA
jgi:hypothetical protein